MDPPPPPKVSPWNLPWKVPVATPNSTPDTVSRSSTIGLGTAQAFAAFPELSTTKLTKAQLRTAKQQTPSLPALSTPNIKSPTLENIPEVPPSRRTPHRSPVRKSPERYRRTSPVKKSPERVPRRAYSEVIASPRKQKKVPHINQKRGESKRKGHVEENIEVSSSLVSVPALPPPIQEKAELVDEQHNAPLSLESRTEFPDLSNEKGSTRKKRKMSYVTSSNVGRDSKSTDEQNATSQSPNTTPQGHDSNSTTPTGSADNHEFATQLKNGDISHTPPSDLPTCNDEISTQSKMEISGSTTQFTMRDVDTSHNKIGAPQTQSEITPPKVDLQIKKSKTEKIEAKDTKSAIDTQSVVDTKVTPAQDEIDTLITSLTTSSSFKYKMNSAAEEKIHPPPAPDGFQFIPLTDDSTYGVLIKTDLNSFQNPLGFPSGTNSHFNTHMHENRQETLAQPIFPDDPPRRYRALTFTSPEAAAYHREVNQPYLKSPEQQRDYDLAVQEGREKVRRQSGFQHEKYSNCGKMVTRRGSVAYVVDVPSLQDAVAEDPALILNRISEMKDEIQDLKLELEKEAGVRKWTVTQYEALHSISIGKQMLLWEYIHRLQHQNRLLMNNQGHSYVESNSSPSLSLSELATYVEGQGSQGFDGNIERKGTARRNSLESNSKLDPNAQAFVPSDRGSPVKSETAVYPSPPPNSTSQSLTHISSHPMITPSSIPVSSTNTTTAAPSIYNPDGHGIPTTISPQTYTLILSSLRSLPTFHTLRSICPFSLTTTTPCPNTQCTLRQLCPAYNNLGPPSHCHSIPCSKLHVYRTCEVESDGGVCEFTKQEGGRGRRNWKRGRRGVKGKKKHLQRRVHSGDVDAEEWRVRCVIGGLRGMHERGVYMG